MYIALLSHYIHPGCLVQRSGWTKAVDTFLQWLYAIPFSGGGFSNVAVAEGLSESLMVNTSYIYAFIQT